MGRAPGLATYHWLFLAQPAPLPERLIGADPDFFLRWTLEAWCGAPGAFSTRALAEYARCFTDPAVIHATCEDYRAGAGIDVEHDAADRGRRKLACPLLALWGERNAAERPWDTLAVWRTWASDVRGRPLACGHFLPEEAPEETAAELLGFLGSGKGAGLDHS
jgi:haloacetate dehalogenase